MPERVIGEIVSWQSHKLDGERTPVALGAQPVEPARRIVARSPAGVAVVERTVQVGTGNLFGIVTEREDADQAPMPAVMFINAGVLPHSGPGRLWVKMARSWAAYGVRVFRVDLGGLGDSPARPGRNSDVVYPVEAIEDIIDAARFIAPDDPGGVALVGLCSGGYHALEGALRLHSRRVWVVNPGLPLVPPELGENGAADSHRQVVRPLNSLTRRLRENDRVVRLSEAATPAAAWWLFDKLRLYPLSTGALETLAQRGTELLVVCSKVEYSLFTKRSRWAVQRLERSGNCHFEVIKSMDHALFNSTGRAELMKLLTAQVLESLIPEFGTATGTKGRFPDHLT